MKQIFVTEPEVVIAVRGSDNQGGKKSDFQVSSNGTTIDWKYSESILPAILSSNIFLEAVATVAPYVLGGGGSDVNHHRGDYSKEEFPEAKEFVRKYAVSIDMAFNDGYVFPPGHPVINQLYLQHPLAHIKGAGKERTYIPHSKYDELLLQERESELIKLLVFLGATRIRVTQKKSAKKASGVQGAASADLRGVGGGEIRGQAIDSSDSDSLDCREFELSGKPWHEGDKLDRGAFAWVNFEPSWESLIVGREIGGCTKAAIELKESSSFSSDKGFEAWVKNKIYGAQGGGSIKSSFREEKVYLVEAEFLPVRARVG